MHGWLDIVLWVLAGAVLAPVVVVCAEVLMALWPRGRRVVDTGVPRPRVAVLVPAHNVEVLIDRTIRNVKTQLMDDERIVVVADNCSDRTATIAREAGAEVVERSSQVQRGKGFALDFGVRHIAATDAPQVLVIVDADVTIRADAIDALARQVESTGCPAQAVYVLSEAQQSSGRDVVSHLAFVVRNHVRPLGLSRIGGPCPLFGAGMAFPFGIIEKAPLASGNIVEDIALALDLAVDGSPPQFCPDARVDGTLPRSVDSSSTQRRRWEHGHLRTIFTHVPRVLAAGLRRLSPRTLMLAADICVPPLSLLVLLLLTIGILLGAVSVLARASWWPALSVAAGLSLLVLAICIAWLRFSPHERAMSALLSVPGYVVQKLPMYFAFFSNRSEKVWIRTERDEAGP